MIEERADIVVAGAGMGGLSAAITARERGRDVLVLEKAPSAGGSAAISSGTLWTATDYERLRQYIPLGDPGLGRILMDEFEECLKWLAAHGVTLEERPHNPYHKVLDRCYGMLPDAATNMDVLCRRFLEMEGRMLTGTALVELLQDHAGRIEGVRAWTEGGSLTVRARQVILATGGFQGNRELLARYAGRWADRMISRSNPHSTGDGLLAAIAAGAAASKGLQSIYGHLMPAPPARLDASNFRSATPYFSEHSVVVNLQGRRFADESLGDESTALEALQQTEAKAAILFDAVVYREFAITPIYPGAAAINRWETVKAAGGRVVEADSRSALLDGVAGWGIHRETLERTVAEFNAAIREGRSDRLEVPRRSNRIGLEEPPFFAIEVVPGITYTFGGLQVDESTRVIDRRGRPIPGLHAAGADAGGVYVDNYAGGLAAALVLGRLAGATAAASL